MTQRTQSVLQTIGGDLRKVLVNLHWLPGYLLQRSTRRQEIPIPFHIILCLADHFEPYTSLVRGERLCREDQLHRVQQWCRSYPRKFDSLLDPSGHPFRHTYFYPAEHYDFEVLESLARHSRDGWGEIEIHLHHGVGAPDTADNLERTLIRFRDLLAYRHGVLSRGPGSAQPRYAFVHGNWALANSGGGRGCGVDSEIEILSRTGCYADLTSPAAPHRAQVSKVNSIYECIEPLTRRACHRHGQNLAAGRPPRLFPLMMQGPLLLDFRRRKRGVFPTIENGELSRAAPLSLQRLSEWLRAAVRVEGRPDWVFVKLHCHGMAPRDTSALLGDPVANFVPDFLALQDDAGFTAHFVTAREMVNMALAACDGESGNPSEFRDYRLQQPGLAS